MGDSIFLYSILLFTTVGITLLCVIALFFKRSSFHPNQYLLAGFLLVNLVQPLAGYIILSDDLVVQFPWVLRISNPILLLQGVFFYLFVRNVLYGKGVSGWDWAFFLPAVIQLIDLIPVFQLSSEEKLRILIAFKQDFVNSHHLADGAYFSMRHSGIFRFLYNAGMVLMAALSIRAYRKHQGQDNISPAQVRWLFYLTASVLLFLVAMFTGPTGVLIQTLVLSQESLLESTLYILNVSLFLNSVGTTAISMLVLYRQDVVFTPPARVRSTPSLSEEELSDVCDRIDHYVTQNQSFRRKGIKITDLSSELSIPTNKISQALNTRHGLNFNQYMNQMRVEYAKKMLTEGRHHSLTIQAIGEEAGFSSRSNFHSVFQSITEMTPVEFANRLNGESGGDRDMAGRSEASVAAARSAAGVAAGRAAGRTAGVVPDDMGYIAPGKAPGNGSDPECGR